MTLRGSDLEVAVRVPFLGSFGMSCEFFIGKTGPWGPVLATGVWEYSPCAPTRPAIRAESAHAYQPRVPTLGKAALSGSCALQGRRSLWPQVSKWVEEHYQHKSAGIELRALLKG